MLERSCGHLLQAVAFSSHGVLRRIHASCSRVARGRSCEIDLCDNHWLPGQGCLCSLAQILVRASRYER